MEKACKSCLDQISQKKIYSTDINKLKRKPENMNYQMLPFYESEYKSKQKNIGCESAREILMKDDYKLVVNRRFERLYIMMECKSYMKNEDTRENKEIFFYGFKHVKKDKVDIYILIGCQSDELYENDKPYNFWSNEFLKKKRKKRDFKIKGWPFLTLVKRNNFFKIQSVCVQTMLFSAKMFLYFIKYFIFYLKGILFQ